MIILADNIKITDKTQVSISVDTDPATSLGIEITNDTISYEVWDIVSMNQIAYKEISLKELVVKLLSPSAIETWIRY